MIYGEQHAVDQHLAEISIFLLSQGMPHLLKEWLCLIFDHRQKNGLFVIEVTINSTSGNACPPGDLVYGGRPHAGLGVTLPGSGNNAGCASFGLINTFVRPILAFVTFPTTVLTLGAFYFVLNGAMLYLAAEIMPGFALDRMLTALIAALVMSVVATILHLFVGTKKKKRS